MHFYQQCLGIWTKSYALSFIKFSIALTCPEFMLGTTDLEYHPKTSTTVSALY